MKTLSKISLGLILLSSVASPLLVSAIEELPSQCTIRRDVSMIDAACPGVNNVAIYDTKYGSINGAMCCLMSNIYYITNLVFLVLTALAVIMIIVAGFFMVTAAGKPEQFGKGRQLAIYAIIGILVALLARLVPGLAKFILAT